MNISEGTWTSQITAGWMEEGWIDGQTGGWMNGWMDRGIDDVGEMDGWRKGRSEGGMDGWMDRWMNGQLDRGEMDGWVDEGRDGQITVAQWSQLEYHFGLRNI